MIIQPLHRKWNTIQKLNTHSYIPWTPLLISITFQAQFFKMFEDEVEHNKNVFVLLKRIMVDKLLLEFNLRGIKGKRALAKYSIVEVMFDAYSDIYTRMSFEKACKQAIKQAHARFYTKTCLSKKKRSKDGRCWAFGPIWTTLFCFSYLNTVYILK